MDLFHGFSIQISRIANGSVLQLDMFRAKTAHTAYCLELLFKWGFRHNGGWMIYSGSAAELQEQLENLRAAMIRFDKPSQVDKSNYV